MKKINFNDLIKLIFICASVFIIITMFGYLMASILVYFKVGSFIFIWEEVFFNSLRKGASVGTVLGIGLWLKSKLQERKDRKESAK